MSDYEQHSGKVRRIIPLEGESFEDLLIRKASEIVGSGLVDKVDSMEILYDQHYVITEDSLYIMEEHIREDECDCYCRLTPNPDGSFSFHTRFYNGGTCLAEMIEDELKQLNQ